MTPRLRSSTDGRRKPADRDHASAISPSQRASFARSLLKWYDRAQRDLPWRHREDDAYAVWLSEMMLQQTQVATVLRYFDSFLHAFPTFEALAAAPLDDVLRAWAGLGYYARARNLHRAAKEIVASHGGKIPRTVDGLLGLPGVGRYTAGAVASIALGVRAPVVDGNVARVLARRFGISADFKSNAGRETFWALAAALVPSKRCGDFNQALMELGATVCRPRSPECSRCPLSRSCVARAAGRVSEFPFVEAARPRRDATFLAIVIRDGDRILIRRRPAGGLWGGLWEVPSVRVEGRARPRSAFAEVVPSSVLSRVGACRPIGELSHELTHLHATFRLYEASLRKPAGRPADGYRWIHPDSIDEVGLGAVQRRLIALHNSHPRHA